MEQGTELVSLALCHGHPCTGTLLHKKGSRRSDIMQWTTQVFKSTCIKRSICANINSRGWSLWEGRKWIKGRDWEEGKSEWKGKKKVKDKKQTHQWKKKEKRYKVRKLKRKRARATQEV